jgi:hypothetical protein
MADTPDVDALAPCAHCGGTAAHKSMNEFNHWIDCTSCKMTTAACSSANEAIATWSRRIPSLEQKRTARVEEALRKTANALENLHAMVWGECPSLLNEDSGGSAHADMAIKDALELSSAALAAGQPTEKVT